MRKGGTTCKGTDANLGDGGRDGNLLQLLTIGKEMVVDSGNTAQPVDGGQVDTTTKRIIANPCHAVGDGDAAQGAAGGGALGGAAVGVGAKGHRANRRHGRATDFIGDGDVLLLASGGQKGVAALPLDQHIQALPLGEASFAQTEFFFYLPFFLPLLIGRRIPLVLIPQDEGGDLRCALHPTEVFIQFFQRNLLVQREKVRYRFHRILFCRFGEEEITVGLDFRNQGWVGGAVGHRRENNVSPLGLGQLFPHHVKYLFIVGDHTAEGGTITKHVVVYMQFAIGQNHLLQTSAVFKGDVVNDKNALRQRDGDEIFTIMKRGGGKGLYSFGDDRLRQARATAESAVFHLNQGGGQVDGSKTDAASEGLSADVGHTLGNSDRCEGCAIAKGSGANLGDAVGDGDGGICAGVFHQHAVFNDKISRKRHRYLSF